MNFLFVALKGTLFDLPIYIDKSNEHTVTSLDEVAYEPAAPFLDPGYEPVETAIQTGKYDYVLTYLFHPVISDICEMYGIRYISIIYDSPQIGLFHQSIYNETNRIFIFDKTEYERFRALEVPHVYYLPLFTDTSRCNSLIMTDDDKARFSSEISFVGKLYEDNLYNEIRDVLAPEIILASNNYFSSKMCNWKTAREWPILDEGAINYIKICDLYNMDLMNYFDIPEELYFGMLLLSRKLGELDRLGTLKYLSQYFNVDFYTTSKVQDAGKSKILPPVNYYTELGKVYRYSKINLNITLPTIETGVPQRIFDIMAYGGFVMSNYQMEIEELFTPGEDIVVFRDLDEAKMLCEYYLTHEDERVRIAQNGYQTVTEKYNAKKALDKILKMCEE